MDEPALPCIDADTFGPSDCCWTAQFRIGHALLVQKAGPSTSNRLEIRIEVDGPIRMKIYASKQCRVSLRAAK